MKNKLINILVDIKNAQAAKNLVIITKKTKSSISILNILWRYGLILGYRVNVKNLKIFLKYKNYKPVINSLKVVSKNSKSIFLKNKQLWYIKSNLLVIISTIKGLKSLNECKKENLGGKVLFIIN